MVLYIAIISSQDAVKEQMDILGRDQHLEYLPVGDT